jgi:hypothetical protein
LGAHFQHAPIDLDEEMEDVEKIGGTNTQLENSQQPNILSILLPTLQPWNLGRLHRRNPMLSLRKHILSD